jgi:FkbM family methyltransferase
MNLSPLFLIRALRRSIGNQFPASRVSYAQDGEDLIIERIFEGKKSGFYVDVGAHHPFRFSNTYRFYRQGWYGLNFDPVPGFANFFARHRPRDIAIEIGVGEIDSHMTYYQFNEPALNTFSLQEVILKNKPPYSLVSSIEISVRPLTDLFDQFLPEGQHIDFMTIDAEGLDLEVLLSNNWEKYRPSLLVVETLRKNMNSLSGCKTTEFLLKQGYVPFCKVYNSSFFLLKEDPLLDET